MDTASFKRLAVLLKRAYAEMEQEALDTGVSVASTEFQDAIAKAREMILGRHGFTIEQYREAKAKVNAYSSADIMQEVESIRKQIQDLYVPSTTEIISIANQEVKKNLKAPEIINRIVKEVTIQQPQIIKETTIEKTVQEIFYDEKPILQRLENLDKQVGEIKIPAAIDIELIKSDLKLEFGKMLNKNIDILGMPDFRKLAMGLQGQIDALGSGGTASPLTTKGDLYTYTTTNARLGVGANSTVLTADSSTPTGLKWTALAGIGDVTKVGTPVDNQIGVWTGDGTIEGDTALTFDTSTNILAVVGEVVATDVVVSSETSTPLTTFVVGAGAQTTPHLQVLGATASATIGFARFSATTTVGPQFLFAKSHGATIGAYDVVSTGELLGAFVFAGSDGVDFAPAASISIYSDGTPGSNDMPGRIVFSTTADAGSAVTDRLILDSLAVLKPATNDGLALGNTTNQFSDLFLAEGGVINWDNGDATLTQVGDVVTLAGADLKVPTAGNVSTSVITTDATQTLTNKTLTSPTLTTPSGFTTGGSITLAENTSIAVDPAGSADGKYTGITITAVAGEALAFGDVIVLDVTAGKWFKGSVSAAAGADGDLRGGTGMCVLAAAGDASATNVLLIGTCRADANFPALTIGSVVYATTSGDITVTQPSTTDHIIKVLGYALTADEIMFCPSMNYMTHT